MTPLTVKDQLQTNQFSLPLNISRLGNVALINDSQLTIF
jgi:hypothetical protein